MRFFLACDRFGLEVVSFFSYTGAEWFSSLLLNLRKLFWSVTQTFDLSHGLVIELEPRTDSVNMKN